MDKYIDKFQIILEDPKKTINIILFLFAIWLLENRNKVFDSIFKKNKEESTKDKLNKIIHHKILSDLKIKYSIEIPNLSLNAHIFKLNYDDDERLKREYLTKTIMINCFEAHYNMISKIVDDVHDIAKKKDIESLDLILNTSYWVDYFDRVDKLFYFQTKELELNTCFMGLFNSRKNEDKLNFLKAIRENEENKLIKSKLEKIYINFNYLQYYLSQIYNNINNILHLNGELSIKLKDWRIKE